MNINHAEALRIFEISSLQGQTEESLRSIYHKLAPKYHPDRGGSVEDFIKLREAYSYLKKTLGKPFEEKTQARNQYSNQEYTHSSIDVESLLRELESYKQAYIKNQDLIANYEQRFNSLIRLINATSKSINQEVKNYQQDRELLKLWLDTNLEKIQKRHERTWWQYVVPVKKLNKKEFVELHNHYVEQYNQEFKKIDNEFVEKILNLYKQNFNQIIRLLDF